MSLVRSRSRRLGPAVVACAAVAMVVLAGCRSATANHTSGAGAPGSIAAEAAPSPPPPALKAAGSGSGSVTQPATESVDALSGRSVVRTAAATVRVDHVMTAAGRLETLAAGDGGYVADEQADAQPDHPEKATAIVTVRVPATRLGQLLAQLSDLGTLVSEEQSSQDVTAQVVDVGARLAAQRASVARVRALLGQATTLGDVVRVEGELAQREAALESLEAEARSLADQTALATVTATLVGPRAHSTPPPVAASTGFGAGLRHGWNAFVTGTDWLLTGIGAALPFLVLLAGASAVALTVLRRRRPRAAQEPPAPSAA
jgi:hypothetical protein